MMTVAAKQSFSDAPRLACSAPVDPSGAVKLGRVVLPPEPTPPTRSPSAGTGRALRGVPGRTALGAALLTAAVVVIRGGARRRHIELRAGHVHVAAAMNTWTAVSRSLGLAALALLAFTLPVGLLFGRRLVARDRRAEVRAAHMTLSLSGLSVAVLHVVTLLGATQLAPDAARLLVPWLWPYRQTATALGVLSIYVVALLGLTYYTRRALGWRRWRIAHRFIAVGLALAVLHVIGGG